MITHVPFTDFALGFSSMKGALNIEQWKDYYSHHFRNINSEAKSVVNIQFSKCNTYKISFDAPIVVEGVGKFSTLPFISTLCVSSELFYLLMHIGEGHQIGSAAISFIKSSDQFVPLGEGRFRCKNNNFILSFEEDEFGKFYLLATSRADLLTIDPLFNFARQSIIG